MTQHKNVSDETARRIDEEVREILDRAYARSTELLTENLSKLHVMAEALLQYETIDAKQIEEIMNGQEVSPPKGWTDDSGKGPGSGTGGAKPRGESPIGGPAVQSRSEAS